VEVRAVAGAPEGTFEAVVLNYNVRDDYNTEFRKGVFTDSLRQRMPRIAWGHDWRQIIGRWVAWTETETQLILRGELDLAMIAVYAADGETIINRLPAVPLAHQAYAQLQSGSVDEFSVGFIPQAYEEIRDVDGEDDYIIFTRGRLDEVSLVLSGAVPGTRLLNVRSVRLNVREPLVAKEEVAALILKLHSGEVDLADALSELKGMEPVADTDDSNDDPDAQDHQETDEGSEPPVGAEDETDPGSGTDGAEGSSEDSTDEGGASDDEIVDGPDAEAELAALLAEAEEAAALVANL